MMIQVFFGAMAFSLCLMAFAVGTWLTVWSTSNSQIAQASTSKLCGYFITVLAIVSLVFTSYYFAKTLFMPSFAHPMMTSPMKYNMMQKQKDMQNKPSKPADKTTKNQ